MPLGSRSKGIKLLRSCYPGNQFESVNHSSLDALIKYVLMNPGKLGEIGKYVEKKVRKGLAKGHLGHVKVSLDIFNAILNSTHANQLTFYAPNLVAVLRELLDPSGDQKVNASLVEHRQTIRFQAVNTFGIFANVRYRHALVEYKDMGFFLDYFLRMAEHSTGPDAERKRVRLHGLKGIHVYVSTLDDLDGFVSNHVDPARRKPNTRSPIASILDNMVAYRDEDPGYLVTPDDALNAKLEGPDSPQEADTDNVYRMATVCLSDLAKSPSATTVSSLLNAVLLYFNERNGWAQENFVNSCIRALWDKQPSHTQVTISQLLYQLDAVTDEKVKVHVVHTIKYFLQQISRGSIGSVIEMLLPITRQLTFSTYRTTEEQPTTNEAIEFETAIVQCIEVIGLRVTDPTEKIEAMMFMVERMRDATNPRTIHMLLQCVLQIAQHVKELPAKGFHKLFEPLLKAAVDKDHPEIRVTVQNILHNLLTPSGHDTRGIEKLFGPLRASLFQTALLPNNQPANFEAIFKTLRILLVMNRSKELEHSIPIMFQLEAAVASPSAPAPRLARCVHTLVAAYFIQVAKLYASTQLEEYIQQTMNGEWSPALLLKDDTLVAVKPHFKKQHSDAPPVTSPLSSDSVIAILGNIHLLTRDYANKDLKSVFLLDPSASLNLLPSALSRLRSDSMSGLRLSRGDLLHPGLERPGTPGKRVERAAFERNNSQGSLDASTDGIGPTSSPAAESPRGEQVTAQLLREIFEAEKDKDEELARSGLPPGGKAPAPAAAPVPQLTYQTAVAISSRQPGRSRLPFLDSIRPAEPLDRFTTDSLSDQSLLRMRFPQLTHATAS